jgi:hypothetical protein
MNVHKCDFCSEETEKFVYVSMGLDFRFELCNYCATPILDYLRECEAINEDNKKIEK